MHTEIRRGGGLTHHELPLTAETVESPLPKDRRGGFGERSGETGRWRHRNRAPDRLDISVVR